MRRLLLLALMPSLCLAGDLSLAIPTIEVTGKYAEAATKAQQAALVQSGAQGVVSDVRTKLEHFGLAQAELLGVSKPLGIVLYCTKVYRDQSIAIRLAQGKRLQLKPNQAALSIDF